MGVYHRCVLYMGNFGSYEKIQMKNYHYIDLTNTPDELLTKQNRNRLVELQVILMCSVHGKIF